MERSESTALLAKAMIKVQAEMPEVKKGSINPFFKSKYPMLPAVMQALLPLLTKNGLCILQPPSNIDGQSAITTILMHESGEYISSTRPLLMPKEDPQGQGSAITYARRYDAMAIVGMAAVDDDDGNKATTGMDDLNKKKKELMTKLVSKKIIDFAEQRTYIEMVLGKNTIDTADEAQLVMDELESK